MKNRLIRLSTGVAIGLVVLAGLTWLLSKALSAHESLYAGKPIRYWLEQIKNHDPGTSNQACAAVNAQVVPQLIETMFHDTNDSRLRLSAIEILRGLPGVEIAFAEAEARRGFDASRLGQLGPAAKAAVPALIQAVKGNDPAIRVPAVLALGQIHSDPDVVIPLLIGLLDDDRLNGKAAMALGDFGSLAKAAIPKLVPMLKVPDKEDRHAAGVALKKIDPVTAAQAGVR